MLYGVDVHDGYQAGLNFPLLRSQGYTFAAIKLTQGTDYARDKGDDWVRAARGAGLIPGGYHWLNNSGGAAQARWFYRKVVESGGPDGMLIQCDNEDNATAQITRDWAAEWEQLSGGHPWLMYSGLWWWPPHLGSFRGADLTPLLWHSHYLTADADSIPDDPAAFAARIPASWWTPGYGGWGQATILQFTSRGDAGALANKVDLNVYRGSREQLLALTRPGTTTTIGDNTMLSDADAKALIWRMEALINNRPKVIGNSAITGEVNQTAATLAALTAAVAAIASKVDIDPAELAAIKQASAEGAASVIPALVDALWARMPADTMTREDVEAAVGAVFARGLVLAPDITP